jgi:hypothetical protein
MNVSLMTDLDRCRRLIHEAESVFGLAQQLANGDECIPSWELQDKIDDVFDAVIMLRCALESAVYEGLDHFDREA